MSEHKHHGHHHDPKHEKFVFTAAPVAQSWNGAPISVSPGSSVTTTPPLAYSIVFITNLGASTASVFLTAGGGVPVPLQVPPQTNQSAMYIANFNGANLNVQNGGGTGAPTITAQLAGFGQPGITPTPITLGTMMSMMPGSYASGTSTPTYMSLALQASTNAATTFAILGGTTPGANPTTRAILIQLNAPANVGPPSGTAFDNTKAQPFGLFVPPENNSLLYAATTTASYNLLYNFGASNIWVVNTSATTAAGAAITLTSLGG
jgi:hypothetical protein